MHALVLAACAALIVGGLAELDAMFVGRGSLAGATALVATGLVGTTGWLTWDVFDAVDSRHAPERWSARQSSP